MKIIREIEKQTRDSSSAVDEDKDHATKGPSDAEDANTCTLVRIEGWIGLALVTNDSHNGDVEEEESGYELSDESSVERPFPKLSSVEQRLRRWVLIVFA